MIRPLLIAKDWGFVMVLWPLWLAFHFINKYDRSILFRWRNQLSTGSHVRKPVSQPVKDLACLAMLALFMLTYNRLVVAYLQDLPAPWLMTYVLWASWGLAVFHAAGHTIRVTLFQLVVTTLSFCIAVLIAGEIREWYLAAVNDLVSNPIAAQYIGQDYQGLIGNRIAGYGGCFAVGALIVRLLLTEPLRRGLLRLFASEAYSPAICPHCARAQS